MSPVLFLTCINTVSESDKMMGRWSNARQSVIDAARALVTSKECTYAMSGLKEVEKAAAARELLDNDAFHFGRANSVSYFLV